MKITLNWLKQYVDFDWSAGELAERFTVLGCSTNHFQLLYENNVRFLRQL